MRMKHLVLGVVGALALSACTHSPDDVRQTVEAFGMSDVQPGGYDFLNCGQDDNFHTKFTATNAQGHRVRGVVCGSLLKGNTVRILGAA